MPENTKIDRGNRKERIGEVISNKMTKTIVVRVQRRFPHPEFKKVVTTYKKFYAHDEKSEAKPGDRVRSRKPGLYRKPNAGAWWKWLSGIQRLLPSRDRSGFMLQVRSILDVADNSGAKRAAAIGVIGRNQRYAGIGISSRRTSRRPRRMEQ